MHNAVMTKKPKAITSKAKPETAYYADYTTTDLADMIASTSEELKSVTKRLNDLHEETEAYQYDLDSAYNHYQDEAREMKQHQERIKHEEEHVKKISNELVSYTNAFTKRIEKQ